MLSDTTEGLVLAGGHNTAEEVCGRWAKLVSDCQCGQSSDRRHG